MDKLYIHCLLLLLLLYTLDFLMYIKIHFNEFTFDAKNIIASIFCNFKHFIQYCFF